MDSCAARLTKIEYNVYTLSCIDVEDSYTYRTCYNVQTRSTVHVQIDLRNSAGRARCSADSWIENDIRSRVNARSVYISNFKT